MGGLSFRFMSRWRVFWALLDNRNIVVVKVRDDFNGIRF